MGNILDYLKEENAAQADHVFAQAGFYISTTGGGCTAWRKDLADGWHILITDSEGTAHHVDADESWLVGTHGPEGEYSDSLDQARNEEFALQLAQHHEIARQFVVNLEAELTAQEMAEIRQRNAKPAYSACCATHDFCDANMPMLVAIETVTGQPFNPSAEAQAAICNAAWDIAKRDYLTTRESN